MFYFFAFLMSFAQATRIYESEIYGNWSDIGCATAYNSFKTDGSFEYRVWDGEKYAKQYSMYWWLDDDGNILLGTTRKYEPSVVAVMVAEEITERRFIGAYAAVGKGPAKGLIMIRCI